MKMVKNKNKNPKGRDVSETENQNFEGKCCHIQQCIKFKTLNNVIPHADLSKCQECVKLIPDASVASSNKVETLEANKESDVTQPEGKDGICVCLQCGNVACSRQSTHQHAFEHFNTKTSHPLVVNLSTWIVWCYKCDDEVNVEIYQTVAQCLGLLRKTLGIKAAKQEKREKPQKKTASNIYSHTGETSTVKGLVNLGNTCFFNSVMQNLCRMQLLHEAMNLLTAGDFEYLISPSRDNKSLGNLPVTVSDKPGPLTSALAKFLHDMKTGSKKQAIHPGYLFTEICKQAPRFRGFRQQDSQELLRYLLDSVRTEEIKVVKRGILHSFGVKNTSKQKGVSADQVDENIHEKIRVYGRNATAPVIDSMFGGQLVSSLECRTCHKVFTIMESFFDLSLSLATTDNNVIKQEKTVTATKKKQLGSNENNKRGKNTNINEDRLDVLNDGTSEANTDQSEAGITTQTSVDATKKKQTANPIPNKKNTKNVNKKNSKNLDNKDTELKPKPPPVLSKYQKKKKEKEEKRKKRKRRNSGSNARRKQNEVDEDEEIGDEKNEASDSDVEEAPVDDVTKSDITQTLQQNVRENIFMNLVKVDDRAGTTSGGEGITLLNSDEGERMSNGQSDAETAKQTSEELTINENNKQGKNANINQDDCDASNDGTSLANIDQSGARITTQTPERLTSNEHDKQGKNININEDSFYVSGESQPEMAATSRKRTEQNNAKTEDDESSVPRNRDDRISECNDFGDENFTEYSKISQNCLMKGDDFSKSIEPSYNGCCNHDDFKQSDPNKISSEDKLREGRSGCNEKAWCRDPLNGEDSKNRTSQHLDEKNALNFTNTQKKDCHTSVRLQKVSNDYYNDDSSVKNNHISSLPENNEECTKYNCETLRNTSSDGNNISNSSVRKEQTIHLLEDFIQNSPDGFQIDRDNKNSTERQETLEYANKIVNDALKDSLDTISTSLPSEEVETTKQFSIDTKVEIDLSSECKGKYKNPVEDISGSFSFEGKEYNEKVYEYVDQIVNQALKHHLHSKSSSLPPEQAKTNSPISASSNAMVETNFYSEGKTTKGGDKSSSANLSSDENEYDETGLSFEDRNIERGNSSSSVIANTVSSLLNDNEIIQSGDLAVAQNSQTGPGMSCSSKSNENSEAYPSQEDNNTFSSEDISKTKTIEESSYSHLNDKDSSSNENTSKSKSTELNSQSSPPESSPKDNDSNSNEDISKTKTIEKNSCSSTKENDSFSKSEDITEEATSECWKSDNKVSARANNIQSVSAPIETDHNSEAGLLGRSSEILSGNHSLGNMETIKSNTMSVESCLKKFCSPEILDGDNKIICEQCNTHGPDEDGVEENDQDERENSDDGDHSSKGKPKRKPIFTEAVKQLLINQAPPILTLHLKRFHQVRFSLKKLAKYVEFPLVLDLAPFCHKSSKVATDSEGKVLYALCGIVEHSGSLHSGHYTAYCRVPTVPSSLFDTKFDNLTQLLKVMEHMWIQGGHQDSYVHEGPSSSRWFHISDSHVSEVGLERVLRAQAYLLFYERMVLSHEGQVEPLT